MNRIVVTEYPKSGGTWVTSLIGDALGWPKRDIYVNEQYKAFDVRKHPWYRGSNILGLLPVCVIKSHELPQTNLHNFPAQFVHLVRGGRNIFMKVNFACVMVFMSVLMFPLMFICKGRLRSGGILCSPGAMSLVLFMYDMKISCQNPCVN